MGLKMSDSDNIFENRTVHDAKVDQAVTKSIQFTGQFVNEGVNFLNSKGITPDHAAFVPALGLYVDTARRTYQDLLDQYSASRY
jgi:hypothetical protein